MKKEPLNLLEKKHKLSFWRFVGVVLLSWSLINALFLFFNSVPVFIYAFVNLILPILIGVVFVIASRSDKEKYKLAYWQFIMGILLLHGLSWLLVRVLTGTVGNGYLNSGIMLLMPIEVAFVIALRGGNVAKAMFIPIAIPTILFFQMLLFSLLGGVIGIILFFGVLTLLSGTGTFIGKMIYNKKSSSLEYDSFSKKIIIRILLILHILLLVANCFI